MVAGYIRGEVVSGKDTTCARLGRHCVRDCTSVTSRHALVTEPSMVLRCCSRATDGHTETLSEVSISACEISICELTGGKDLTGFCAKLSLLRSNCV
jgi:hypothetical protein